MWVNKNISTVKVSTTARLSSRLSSAILFSTVFLILTPADCHLLFSILIELLFPEIYLVQISPDTVLWLVEPYWADDKVYVITTHLKPSKMLPPTGGILLVFCCVVMAWLLISGPYKNLLCHNYISVFVFILQSELNKFVKIKMPQMCCGRPCVSWSGFQVSCCICFFSGAWGRS